MTVVFDAQCLLCNAWVKFLSRHDRRRVFSFASTHGAAGQELLADAGLKVDGLQTLLLVDGEASLPDLRALGGLHPAAGRPCGPLPRLISGE